MISSASILYPNHKARRRQRLGSPIPSSPPKVDLPPNQKRLPSLKHSRKSHGQSYRYGQRHWHFTSTGESTDDPIIKRTFTAGFCQTRVDLRGCFWNSFDRSNLYLIFDCEKKSCDFVKILPKSGKPCSHDIDKEFGNESRIYTIGPGWKETSNEPEGYREFEFNTYI